MAAGLGAATHILVDWGTSNLRAFLVDAAGRIIDRRQGNAGIMGVPPDGFEAALMAEIGPWLKSDASLPVMMSGMIGSRQGWAEVPYAECPVAIEELALGMKPVTGRKHAVLIAPGLSWRSPSGHFDVMRGEETQVFGAMALLDEEGGSADGLYCLPGTHSKWVKVEGARIVDFSTCMTGELFSVLCRHSILGKLMDQDAEDELAFEAGLQLSGEDGGLLSHLFCARADVLMGAIGQAAARSYLSGILIGHELNDKREAAMKSAGPVTLVGAPALTRRYRLGLDRIGVPAREIDAEIATVRGLLRLAKARRDQKERAR